MGYFFSKFSEPLESSILAKAHLNQAESKVHRIQLCLAPADKLVYLQSKAQKGSDSASEKQHIFLVNEAKAALFREVLALDLKNNVALKGLKFVFI